MKNYAFAGYFIYALEKRIFDQFHQSIDIIHQEVSAVQPHTIWRNDMTTWRKTTWRKTTWRRDHNNRVNMNIGRRSQRQKKAHTTAQKDDSERVQYENTMLSAMFASYDAHDTNINDFIFSSNVSLKFCKITACSDKWPVNYSQNEWLHSRALAL